jgi:RNA polymerase sigma factor (sigma-70 family)
MAKSIQEMANEWIKTRSESTFKEIVNRLTPGMHKHIMDIEKDPFRRSEILNDAFSKIWTKIEQYDSDSGAFSTWVYRIVRNEALLSKRHTNRVSSLDEMIENNISSYKNSMSHCIFPDDEFDTKISDSIIDDLYTYAIDAIKNFPVDGKYAKWKRALTLKEIEGMRFSEIAEKMNENENTVKGWVCKARRHLSTILEKSQTELVTDYKKLKCIYEK